MNRRTLSVHSEGDVGKRGGARERVGDYVEHIHGGATERDGYCCGGCGVCVCCVMPGLLVDLVEVQCIRLNFALGTSLVYGTDVPRRRLCR